MVVQHNLTAMNSNRMLGITTKSQSKSTEKLSSGYKINRAADDAAGLSISEKMRKQIRGLTQASLNAQDGISAVQTAEGALTEVHDMLQRMNELAVKAANGTNSQDDRDYIQSEVDQLISEIDRVAETTKFNETYLLKGDDKSETTVAGSVSFNEVTFKAAGKYNVGYSVSGSSTYHIMAPNGKEVAKLDASSSAEEVGKYVDSKTGQLKDGYKAYSVAVNTSADYGAMTAKNAVATLSLKAVTQGLVDSSGAEVKLADLKAGGTYFTAKGVYSNNLYAYSGTVLTQVGADQLTNFLNISASVKDEAKYNGPLSFNLQVGAEGTTNNQIGLNIKSMSAAGIGINGLDVSSEDTARAAIDTVKQAIQKVSEQRSELGAIQNRLEHTINNLDNVVENTTSAESQIRDTDMATEMVKYSNNNILAQAGQAMLAQSNQANQGVLSLLG